MTLEKAIKILTPGTDEHCEASVQEQEEAERLGIEALKAWKEAQREQRWPSTMRLPGETKE